jgi:hypothetical protein
MNSITRLLGSALTLGVALSQVSPAYADCIRERDSVFTTFTCSVAQDGVSLQASANQQALTLAIQQADSVTHTGFDDDGNSCVQRAAGTLQCDIFLTEHSLVAF